MQRKLVLAIVLCLAVAAALSLGVAPALAADTCTCHTAMPPTGGAPAAHTPFVAGVAACTICHKGMTVPHPKLVKPKLKLGADLYTDKNGKSGVSLAGRLTARGRGGLNGVVVYLQQRAPGETVFVDVRTVTTHKVKRVALALSYNHPNGWFSGRVTSPIWGATYRAVTRGVGGKPVVKPTLTETLIYPAFGVDLRGPDKHGDLTLGRSVVASGGAIPAELLAGEKVTLTLKQHWKVRIVGEATIGSDGRYSWEVTPTLWGPGYKIRARLPATAEHWGVTRGIAVNFRVK